MFCSGVCVSVSSHGSAPVHENRHTQSRMSGETEADNSCSWPFSVFYNCLLAPVHTTFMVVNESERKLEVLLMALIGLFVSHSEVVCVGCCKQKFSINIASIM